MAHSPNDGIAFECSICGESSRGADEPMPAWARLVAFDSANIRLLGEDDADGRRAALAYPDGWSQGAWVEVMPAAAGRYLARVQHHFAARPGAPFWFVFQPSTTLSNGWDDDPTEILQSGFLRADLVEVLHREDAWALVVVEVSEWLTIPSLSGRWPRTGAERAALLFQALELGRGTCYGTGDYVVVDVNVEGDAGAWWLFEREATAANGTGHRLLVHSVWGCHRDPVWAGNHALTPAESAALTAFLSR